jgi:adenylate kinase family enzyme
VLYFDENTGEETKDTVDAGIKEVIDKYKLFGKVRFINANQEVEDIYNDVKHAIMPEVFFLIGPKGSGKTTIGTTLAHRTNMLLMNFDEFIKKNSLTNSDDETIVFKLIKTLLNEVSPRILLEGFPQNQAQARCFIKN